MEKKRTKNELPQEKKKKKKKTEAMRTEREREMIEKFKPQYVTLLRPHVTKIWSRSAFGVVV